MELCICLLNGTFEARARSRGSTRACRCPCTLAAPFLWLRVEVAVEEERPLRSVGGIGPRECEVEALGLVTALGLCLVSPLSAACKATGALVTPTLVTGPCRPGPMEDTALAAASAVAAERRQAPTMLASSRSSCNAPLRRTGGARWSLEAGIVSVGVAVLAIASWAVPRSTAGPVASEVACFDRTARSVSRVPIFGIVWPGVAWVDAACVPPMAFIAVPESRLRSLGLDCRTVDLSDQVLAALGDV